MLKNFVKIFGGDPNKKTIEQFRAVAHHINSLDPEFEAFLCDSHHCWATKERGNR